MSERDPVDLVADYVAASQRARASHSEADLAEVRRHLADDVVVRMAAPWTDRPWRTVLEGADRVVERLKAPINTGASLTTETVTTVRAGDDVLVEQLSTLHRKDGDRVSMVCHIFTVTGDLITGVRSYRNDLGLPTD